MIRRLRQYNEKVGGLYLPSELGAIERLSKQRDTHLVQGYLTIVQYEAEDLARDTLAVLDEGSNLIVDTGREALRELQAQTAETNNAAGNKDLGFLGVGDGSNEGASIPSTSTTGLFNELTTGSPARPTLSVTAPPPSPNTVNLWTAQIGSGELNGSIIDEAALFCLDGTMYAMRTFAGQAKSTGFAMEFRWTQIF
jgi:hypothetical protein